MRIHRLENVSKALRFLCAHGAHMENLGAQDIVDGNPRLTLGLIWTIILHFQVGVTMTEKIYVYGGTRIGRYFNCILYLGNKSLNYCTDERTFRF